MKRSEVLKLIRKLRKVGEDWVDDETWAENLLCHLEEAGMLPQGINENGDGESFDYEWEKE